MFLPSVCQVHHHCILFLILVYSNLLNKCILLHHTLYFSGAYVPLTTNGMLMVNGVLVSCYADFHHDVAHLSVIPMKVMSLVLEWILGNDTGFPVYVSTARQLGMMFLPDENIFKY